ncbi:MAG: hypothetical protein MJ180_04390, partial [Candidatus Gastranaerophilales bacterium]|nr:hypothetical protein [Candidatus Gastranaerophilales bacterium]
KFIASHDEVDIATVAKRIKERGLLTMNLNYVELLTASCVSDNCWNNISARKLSTYRTSDNGQLSHYNQILLATLYDKQWEEVKNSNILTGTSQEVNQKIQEYMNELAKKEQEKQRK